MVPSATVLLHVAPRSVAPGGIAPGDIAASSVVGSGSRISSSSRERSNCVFDIA